MGRLVLLASLLTLGLTVPPASAADTEVDLELVLAVDVSRSMDIGEQQLQRDGYVAAFRHPEVIQAIQSGAVGRIAVTYFEWAGPGFQVMIAPWTVIANAADAETFAQKLSAGSISRETGTSISSGLYYAAGRFDNNGFTSYRQAIDVSGDGPNNAGRPIEPTRDWVVGRGITINGLPIVIRPSFTTSAFGIPNLDQYYEDCVIGGPGAFMIAVTDAANFETAIRRKLVTEISGLPAKVMNAADVAGGGPKADCTVGEKTRPGFMLDFR
ncbi:MAG: DUF1194 domain-containing protein [Bauldia sp.]